MKSTKEMIAAGAEAARKHMEETGGNSPAVVWDAMWAARRKEPEQEIVAYMSQDGDFYAPDEIVCMPKSKILTALYTTPPQQQEPHKMPIPPGQAPITDICYAEGWNACCDAFFGGLPPPEPLIITIEREVPAQRNPLTDEELDLICEKALFCRISFQKFARSIEAAHGIGDKT